MPLRISYTMVISRIKKETLQSASQCVSTLEKKFSDINIKKFLYTTSLLNPYEVQNLLPDSVGLAQLKPRSGYCVYAYADVEGELDTEEHRKAFKKYLNKARKKGFSVSLIPAQMSSSQDEMVFFHNMQGRIRPEHVEEFLETFCLGEEE